MQPINLFSFPRAILHVDGDCFFASCEVAKNPALRGKPVITGMERGIVSSCTYEAKAQGVRRGMRLFEVRKICPNAVFMPSDYETYSLFSLRMFHIVRRYTPVVEEYSIDECFADLTGMQRPLNMSYERIGKQIQEELDRELGMTFSVGLAPTKSLAKIASKWKKPSGFTAIPGRDIHIFLQQVALEKIWGVGPKTSAYLRSFGVMNALQFAAKPKEWVQEKFTKPHVEIWEELRGHVVHEVDPEEKQKYQSISKTKTFTPASNDSDYVYSHLSKNIENACIKARRHNLSARKIFFFIKTQDYRFYGAEIKLTRSTNMPVSILQLVREHYPRIFDPMKEYRATGIILLDLKTNESNQLDFFSDEVKIAKISKIYDTIDGLSKKFGKHSVFLGSSMKAMLSRWHEGERGDLPERRMELFQGETKRKRLNLPFLGVAQ